MIREERLQSTKEMVKKYANSKDILKVNYDNVCGIIEDMQENNKKLFINAFGDDFTLEEEIEIKKMYSKALKDVNMRNKENKKYVNKLCSIETIIGEKIICVVTYSDYSSLFYKSEFGFGRIYKDDIKEISIIGGLVESD